jgi:hypothetical protein
MPTWVSSKVLKFPLNEYATATLTASNVSYFSPTKLTEMTGVKMEATYTIKGNAAAGSSSTAVWNQFIYVYDQTNKLPFQTMTRTFAFNRRTAQLIDCCGANVSGDSSVDEPHEATAESPAIEQEAPQPEAVQPEAEADTPEAPAAESAETPESPMAEDAPAEAPTAEMSTATSDRPLSLAPQHQQQVPGEELPQHGHAEQRPGPAG